LEIRERTKELSDRIRAGDKRFGTEKSDLMDAPRDVKGFVVDEDDFVAGTPEQVAEQIIEQCRAVGAGHFLAILGRGVEGDRGESQAMFGERVIPILRSA
jgi:alkanesulfonate monooxygenase SsuD/methylene tetrahydromethanopterin reductase-like flavin-dependent oxidoreductase (luciferase family)